MRHVVVSTVPIQAAPSCLPSESGGWLIGLLTNGTEQGFAEQAGHREMWSPE